MTNLTAYRCYGTYPDGNYPTARWVKAESYQDAAARYARWIGANVSRLMLVTDEQDAAGHCSYEAEHPTRGEVRIGVEVG